ncbi:MAG TPA: 30S ribosomal protein S1 [Pelagibacterales bacterium]|nr:30S ribosomal protein S1 [Pelagibacterales bacterium]
MQKNLAKKITNSEYEKLISNSLQQKESKEKSIVNGKIIAIENDMAIVDVGLKSEGRIPLSEFTRPGQKAEIKLGEMLEVFIENVDGANGETKLSREKAIKQSAWNYLQDCYNKNEVVTGIPFNRVKGGMSVDLDGVIAFLPGSQIDSRKIIKDTKELLNKPLDLMILKMDKFRGNIVVSRKAISDIELKEQRQALLSNISEGSVISGKIKNITDYGVFVDLGGIDGLLHVTDISWKKISHPSDVLELGAQIDVKILKFDEELTRLSLGIKQLSDDPWLKVNDLYSVDQKIKSPVSSISDQGVSIIVDENYDGFIPLGELTWLKKPPHPSKVVELNQELEVKITEIDNEKRRLICSLKHLKENPWKGLTKKYSINSNIDTEVVNVVDFGIFVKVHEEIDGMVHVSDLSWNEETCSTILSDIKKGDIVKVKILDINVEKERISLGIKQLEIDPVQKFINDYPLKSRISGKITAIDDKGLTINLGKNVNGYIKKTNLSKDKIDQKVERFAIGEMVDSMIVSIDNKTRNINLSIKEIEIDDEKKTLSKYGSSDSGASLGDILGSVIEKKNNA